MEMPKKNTRCFKQKLSIYKNYRSLFFFPKIMISLQEVLLWQSNSVTCMWALWNLYGSAWEAEKNKYREPYSNFQSISHLIFKQVPDKNILVGCM